MVSRSNRLFSGPNNDNRIPEIHLAGYTGTDYTTASWPWHNKADDYQIRDDISWTKGAHQIKMGGSWAIYKKIQDLFGNTQGRFTFNNTYTGNDFADFLLGYADSYNELAVQDHGLWNNVSWAAYVQDNWRVNHRLTLNLGLAMGWRSAYLRSQQPDGELLSQPVQSSRQGYRSFADGSATQSEPALGWGQVPTPFWRVTSFI